MPKKKNHSTPVQDSQRFLDAVAELECDVSDEDFASTVKKVMQAPAISNDELKKGGSKKE